MDILLDTSGIVEMPITTNIPSMRGMYMAKAWKDLSPFAQGYVEALVRGQNERIATVLKPGLNFRLLAFSDLAPETLARIIEDCELAGPHWCMSGPAVNGRAFWELRQNPGAWRSGVFPPLTVSLGDDGKVRFIDPA